MIKIQLRYACAHTWESLTICVYDDVALDAPDDGLPLSLPAPDEFVRKTRGIIREIERHD